MKLRFGADGPGDTLGQTLARARNAVTDDLPTDIIDLASKSIAH